MYPSSADEHLGCFALLTIVNNLLLTFVYKILRGHVSILSGVYLGEEWLSHVVILGLTRCPLGFQWMIREELPALVARAFLHVTRSSQ